MKNPNEFFKYSSLGIEFAATVLIFIFLGLYFDKKFNTIPLFILIGSFVGFTGGIYLLLKAAKQMEKMNNKDKDNSNNKDKK